MSRLHAPCAIICSFGCGARHVFAAAAMLTGLLALGVPWWLHRLRSHGRDRRVVSSLFLMRETAQTVTLQKTLRHRVLLGVRLALLALLVLAFARPFVDLDADVAGADGGLVLIAIDTSLSMTPHIDAARAEARAIVAARRPARVVIVAAGPELVLVGSPVPPGQLDSLLTELAVTPGRLAYAGLTDRLVTLAESHAAAGEDISLHFLSDMQATGIGGRFNALLSDSHRATHLHRVGEPFPNWAITGVRVDKDTLIADVAGYGVTEESVAVVLTRLDGPRGEAEVRKMARPNTPLTFPLSAEDLRSTRSFRFALEADDALPADDVRYLSLIAGGKANLPVLGMASPYFPTAVRATGLGFKPHSVDAVDGGIKAEDLEPDAVPIFALVDPGALPSEVEASIARYVRAGGNLFVSGGPRTRRHGRIPVSGTPVTSRRFQRESHGVTTIDAGHPAVRNIADWRGVTVTTQLVPSDEPVFARVIASTDDGSPLLIESEVGGGRVLVLLTALDPAWSSLVVAPAFVGLVTNVLAYLAGDAMPVAGEAGAAVAIPAISVQIFDPDGEPVLALAETTRPTVRLMEPGVHTVRTPAGTRPLAINIPAAESDPTPMANDVVARWQDSLAATRQLSQEQASGAGSGVASIAERLDVGWYLLFAVLVFALGESVLASRTFRAGGQPESGIEGVPSQNH